MTWGIWRRARNRNMALIYQIAHRSPHSQPQRKLEPVGDTSTNLFLPGPWFRRLRIEGRTVVVEWANQYFPPSHASAGIDIALQLDRAMTSGCERTRYPRPPARGHRQSFAARCKHTSTSIMRLKIAASLPKDPERPTTVKPQKRMSWDHPSDCRARALELQQQGHGHLRGWRSARGSPWKRRAAVSDRITMLQNFTMGSRANAEVAVASPAAQQILSLPRRDPEACWGPLHSLFADGTRPQDRCEFDRPSWRPAGTNGCVRSGPWARMRRGCPVALSCRNPLHQ